MDRLTIKGCFGWQPKGNVQLRGDISKATQCFDRLAEYEDTGFEPSEITDLATELSSYRTAEAEGRLHIAPCADGTPTYRYVENDEMFPNIKPGIYQEPYMHGYTEFHNGELGKDWFLERDEAIKASQRCEACEYWIGKYQQCEHPDCTRDEAEAYGTATPEHCCYLWEPAAAEAALQEGAEK